MLDKKVFSNRLKKLRIERNLSQESLGEIIGLTKAAVSMIESAQRAASIDVFIALADYFDVSIDYLAGRSDVRERR